MNFLICFLMTVSWRRCRDAVRSTSRTILKTIRVRRYLDTFNFFIMWIIVQSLHNHKPLTRTSIAQFFGVEITALSSFLHTLFIWKTPNDDEVWHAISFKKFDKTFDDITVIKNVQDARFKWIFSKQYNILRLRACNLWDGQNWFFIFFEKR